MLLTETLDLRGGRPCWQDADAGPLRPDPAPERTEIAIIGAGVMGAMLAQRLAADGRKVAVFDRRPPATGSTAASTALVMWAADVPLTHLSARIGQEAAARTWRRVHDAVLRLGQAIEQHDDRCRWCARPELYFAGTLLDEAGLRAEAEARHSARLPSDFLDAPAVAARFGLPARAALLSADSFEVDPVALTVSIFRRAQASGATLSFPVDVTGLAHAGNTVILTDSEGRQIEADQVILATGYETSGWFLPQSFALGSSFAIATKPGTAPVWSENALIWEASDPYLYARTSADGRIIIGGEDEDIADATTRDALIGTKRGILEASGAKLLGMETLTADCAWSATFGRSPDGLPAIGRARNSERLWLASGFGGNGISFAALAAELIAAELSNAPDADAALFDPYRSTPA